MRPQKLSEVRLEKQLARVLGRWLQRQGGAIETFADARLLTPNRGLVLTLPDGTEFQISIMEGKPRW